MSEPMDRGQGVALDPSHSNATPTYPVHVEASLDSRLSRWQWLVKWLLVIPHYVVLAFLWLAFVVLSIGAFFAILTTGRYPRSIFEFNVGVLRWSWRVAYYAYGALGTDRYPPFSLKDKPDYPAHLEVDYPEHLSRGLVLVKWWLLAIPHYLIVGFFLGGAGYAVDGASDQPVLWGTGLIGVLALVAGVALLFTGRYPRALFDFLLGLNRWVLRVAGYAGLMTDQYPPFRLDQGGSEGHGQLLVEREAPVPPGHPAAQPTRKGWTAGRVVSLVAGCVLAVGSVSLGLGGVGLAFTDATMRDDAGFLMSGEESFTSDTYAITSDSVEIHADAPATLMPNAVLGDAKLTATAHDGPVFVGIARTADAVRYLRGVQHDTLVDMKDSPVYRTTDGTAPRTPPTSADIWVAQSSGAGTQEITWPVQNGDWTVVVMNADSSHGIHVDMAAGAEVPALHWVIGVMLLLAGVGLVAAIPLIAIPVRRVSTERAQR
jgi:Domain of unknown function (DUF4389)